MNQRRVVINFKPTGWLGWFLVALLAVPLLLLSFFFIAAAVLLTVVIAALTAVRVYWLVRTARKRQPFSYGNEGRQPSGEIIDVEQAEMDDASAVPPNTRVLRLRHATSDENGDTPTNR